MTRSVEALLYVIRPSPAGFFTVSLHELSSGLTSPKGVLGEPCESLEEARLFVPGAAEFLTLASGTDEDTISEVWALRLVPRGTLVSD